MKPHTQASSFATGLPHVTYFRDATAARAAPSESPHDAAGLEFRRVWAAKRCRVNLSVRRSSRVSAASKPSRSDGDGVETRARSGRRGVLMAPFLVAGASILLSAAARAEEKAAEPPPAPKEEEEEVITSRIYDATVIGEPLAIGKEKGKVWEKLMNGRVVYLGEAEQVPVRDDRELELEIVKNLHKRCVEKEKRLSLALEIFPS
ncbi:RETICULATA-RELATED 6 [Spatholobus suberectus]|nr:RETICULATA-RELATED 6 [Spatholobus suberectus]